MAKSAPATQTATPVAVPAPMVANRLGSTRGALHAAAATKSSTTFIQRAQSSPSLVSGSLAATGNSYITTDAGHLRHETSKQVLADIPAGTNVVSLEKSARVSLGFFSIAKDHTLVHSTSYGRGWMRDEVLKRAPPQASSSSPPSTLPPLPTMSAPVRAAPMTIASGHRKKGPATVASSIGTFPEHGYPPVASAPVTPAQQRAFDRLHVYMHFTKPEYRGNIHMNRLIPGIGEGIGLPSDEGGKGESDQHNIYVVSGSPTANPKTLTSVSMEAGEADVVLNSRGPAPDLDSNYKPTAEFRSGGAYRFPGRIPTGRNYTGGASTISLVLPLTNTAKFGLASFINQAAAESETVTSAQAEFLLSHKLFELYPMRYMSYQG